MARTYPALPLRRLVQARAAEHDVGVLQLSDALRIPRRSMQRAMTREQLRWDTADRLAVALGHHPSELWPDWFTPMKETA